MNAEATTATAEITAAHGSAGPVSFTRPSQICVHASHGWPIAGFSATKNPLDTNHDPTVTLLFTRYAAMAQSGHSARPRTARSAAGIGSPRRTRTTNASPIAVTTIGHAS